MVEQIETFQPALRSRHSAPVEGNAPARRRGQRNRTFSRRQAGVDPERERKAWCRRCAHSAGELLGAEVRTDMEQRRRDFSQVRVHMDVGSRVSYCHWGAAIRRTPSCLVLESIHPIVPRRLLRTSYACDSAKWRDQSKPDDDLSVHHACAEGTPRIQRYAGSEHRSQVKDTSHFVPGYEIDVAEGRAFAQEAIAAMSGYGGVKVSAPPSDLVASTEAPPSNSGLVPGAKSDTTLVQTFPLGYMVQRSGGGSVKPEAGFVASIQLCYDACTGEVSVVGWFWAGGGVVTKGLLEALAGGERMFC